MRKILICIILLFGLCACGKSLTKQDEVPVGEVRSTPAVETTVVPSLAPTVHPISEPTEIPTIKPTPTPMITKKDFPLQMPERKVVMADSDTELVPVDKVHFSSDSFQNYILFYFDKDKDGFLSKQERDAVTIIDWSGYFEEEGVYSTPYGDGICLDGLEWFENLEGITATNGVEIYLQGHKNIEWISIGEAATGTVWIDNCPKLKKAGFIMVYGTLFIQNCMNLEEVYLQEAWFDAVHLDELPNLVLKLDETCTIPDVFRLDARARIMYSGERAQAAENGMPCFGINRYEVDWVPKEETYYNYADAVKKMMDYNLSFTENTVIEKIEKNMTEHPNDGRKAYWVWLQNMGHDYFDETVYGGENDKFYRFAQASNQIGVITMEEPKAECFQYAPVRGDSDVCVYPMLYSPTRTSVFRVETRVWMNYEEGNSKHQIGTKKIVHFYIVDPTGNVSVGTEEEVGRLLE